jgi:hypothetical protein
MKNNVYSDFKGKLTPANFLGYWQNKFEKFKEKAETTKTKHDGVIQKVAEE